jgi:hypothetical protein
LSLIFTILLVLTFALILYQDIKDRVVYWFLYPLIGVLCFSLSYYEIGLHTTIVNFLINISVISFIIGISKIYVTIKMKKTYINEVIGLGDLLFFFFICFSFAPITFIILFTFSLLFSLVIHLILNKKQDQTVPLAGYMSLFYSSVYTLVYFSNFKVLYAF